ncbi:hypothetical protein BBJ28_00008088 [Nothophytophthora sp. Chile5]|nr:hypothetical protein BBJ28_00008088 [Nothophytophthora sp. Chile5]
MSGGAANGDSRDAESGPAAGLRARTRQQKARQQASVKFGVASANAFLTANRLKKRAPRKSKPPPLAERMAAQQAAADEARGRSKKRAKRSEEEELEETEPEEEGEEDDDKLHLPPHGEMLAALKEADECEETQRLRQRKQLEQVTRTHFPTWKSELLAGYNLLFYGVGSKLALLQVKDAPNEFAVSHLSDGLVVQLHGYLPIVSLRFLVAFIQEEVLEERRVRSALIWTIDDRLVVFRSCQVLKAAVKPNRTLLQQCRDIAKVKPSERAMPPVYLMVHSIDGLSLRTPEAQTCLSWLAKASFIAVVASMDHINGPSIWKEEDSLRFEWLSQSLNTCEPYTNEMELRLTKRTKTADASSSGVKFILQSLTPTDVGTLREVARLQLAAQEAAKGRRGKTKEAKLAAYQSVFEACRKKLLHSNHLAMKNSIKCLEDHGLVKQTRVHSVEFVEIPLPEPIIRMEILKLERQD